MLTPSARSDTRTYSFAIAGVLAVLGVLPLGATLQYLLATAMAWAIAAIGLDLFSGYLGQPSFGHAGFVGAGAYGVTILNTQAHLPFVAAAAGSLVIVAAIAAVVGLALVRLRDFGLVLGTFFLSYLVTSLLSGTSLAGITHSESGLALPVISLGGLNLSAGKTYYYLCFVVLLLAIALTSNYVGSRSGRALRLVKRSDVVANALGVPSRWVKLKAFVYSAVLAGVAGILLVTGIGYIAPENFAPEQSIILFAMVAVGGMGSIAGPILGALLFTLAPNYLQAAKTHQDLVFAALLLVTLVLFRDGLFGIVDGASSRLRKTLGRRWPRWAPIARTSPVGAQPAAPATVVPPGPVLEVADVHVNYDGVRALDGVTFALGQGEIHALIGPNGAGKTTLLNCVTGLEPVSTGRLRVFGHRVSRGRSSRARQLGVTRTFQNPALVPDLSAVENVMLGLYAGHRRSLARDLLGLNRRHERDVTDHAVQALCFVGVAPSRHFVLANDLNLADAKLVDIARAVVVRGCLLVMDEPTAGLSGPEMTAIADVIRKLHSQTTVTVLLVSHHVAWVREVAQQVTVLAAGQVIARGTPAEVTADPRVREVFLGADAGSADELPTKEPVQVR